MYPPIFKQSTTRVGRDQFCCSLCKAQCCRHPLHSLHLRVQVVVMRSNVGFKFCATTRSQAYSNNQEHVTKVTKQAALQKMEPNILISTGERGDFRICRGLHDGNLLLPELQRRARDSWDVHKHSVHSVDNGRHAEAKTILLHKVELQRMLRVPRMIVVALVRVVLLVAMGLDCSRVQGSCDIRSHKSTGFTLNPHNPSSLLAT